ncbi:MAG TPA: GNAT family N-acetyltransferase, partial [Gaiellales bacterium]
GSHTARRGEGAGLDLAITEGDAPLGAIGLNVDWGADDAVLGYWVAQPARGRGLATGALRLVSDWARAELRLTTLKLTTMRGNGASERVATKAGFTAVRVVEDCDLGTKHATVTLWELGTPT